MQLDYNNTPDFKILNYRGEKINKKDLIKSSALEMVQKSGLSNFSMKRLCQNLKMAQSGIFYYYPTLPDLFYDLAIHQLEMETSILIPYIQNTKQVKRAVRRYFIYFIQYYLQNIEVFKATYANAELDNLNDDKKLLMAQESFAIASYIANHYTNIETQNVDFLSQLKLLKLSAITLLNYYVKNLTETEKHRFEDLVNLQLEMHSKMMF
jgi:AcrR family transcriptional regulator